MVFLFLIVQYINKMATDRGGGVVDGRHSVDCKRNIGPRLNSPPVSFFCTVKIDFVQIHWFIFEFVEVAKFCLRVIFVCFWHSVPALSLSHVTVRHSKIIFQTSTSGSRRFKSDAPCSPIGALLFPTLLSSFFIFHPICLKQIPSYDLSWVASSYFDPIINTTFLPIHMYELVQLHTTKSHVWIFIKFQRHTIWWYSIGI